MTTRAAAMISPVDESVVEEMRLFGYHLGIAFQIMDDVLDFTGEQAEVGKPVGSDLLQGLITLPTLYYMDEYPEDPGIRALLDGRYLLEREKMEKLVEAIRGSNATQLALKEGQAYIDLAVQHLCFIPEREERQVLEDLAHYIVNRRI
jgi:geranylgeranyl pyrophosphate synthase